MRQGLETKHGATVVITHRVLTGQESAYEAWIEEIAPVCRSYPGHLDWQIIRPIPGLTSTYTVIIRFATGDQLQGWMGSSDRARLIERVRPLLADDDAFVVKTGLEFWFAADRSGRTVPVRWKQFLATWSVIFPLVLGVPLVVTPALGQIGLPDSRYVTTFFVTGIVVALMTYVVMPRYSRLIHWWLVR